ncbi:MAG: hypothetical protein ACRCST_13330 [Turicibacter sp.]
MYEQRQKEDKDYLSQMMQAQKMGIEIGKEIGKEEGIEEERQRNKLKQIESAMFLYQSGLSREQIAIATDLSGEEIAKLLNQGD